MFAPDHELDKRHVVLVDRHPNRNVNPPRAIDTADRTSFTACLLIFYEAILDQLQYAPTEINSQPWALFLPRQFEG